ncbi:YjjG family noncanonical pyrimidine nucleotidase [Robiginitalea biformata]|uniref:Putative haloacid dehalogenase-like hydrolase protein n=1 Tax=Robiginitalea biformata (strain ATCC BAA-864 / DSM 15991 / KCTC 12146 / HTCC2501) TaxID=313596 RepID=A4CJS8_ROBBH|nr:YjjG family noncanonical pyrimidine nucleotidase [Robiginitalea biformata]EAR17186.1 putative haloacid dehalogenase-like hydrolase protein [Robiginitalea biformata HTCC2501]
MIDHPVTDIFFDLDHTLWDFERNSEVTYRNIFREAGLPVDVSRFLQVYIPLNLQLWKEYREGRIQAEELRYRRLRIVFDRLDLRLDDRQINQLAQAYIDQLSLQTHLVPGAADILGYLSGKYRLHIITNGFGEVQYRKLRNSRIDSYFSEIVHSEQAGVKKPDPRIFQLATELAGVPASRSVMVGDSLEADVLGARSAGLQTVHFHVHPEPADTAGPVIYGLEELKSLL